MMHPLFQQILAPFMSPVHQKSAKEIQMIDRAEEKILCEEWGFDLPGELGWFTLYIYKSTWPTSVECFKKNFFPWEFREFCEKQGYEFGKDFDEWWNSWTTPMQRVIVEDFIRANATTLQKELDEYYKQIS